jgi:hypothetical protein
MPCASFSVRPQQPHEVRCRSNRCSVIGFGEIDSSSMSESLPSVICATENPGSLDHLSPIQFLEICASVIAVLPVRRGAAALRNSVLLQ